MLENIKVFDCLAEEIKAKLGSWDMAEGIGLTVVVTPEELLISYKNCEAYSGGLRIVSICMLDEIVDITFRDAENIVYHMVLDTQAKDGYVDIKNCFVCDADAGVIGTIQDHFGVSWKNVANRYETLCEQLDKAIEAAKKPTLEEWLHERLNEIFEEGPEEWDDEDDED